MQHLLEVLASFPLLNESLQTPDRRPGMSVGIQREPRSHVSAPEEEIPMPSLQRIGFWLGDDRATHENLDRSQQVSTGGDHSSLLLRAGSSLTYPFEADPCRLQC